MIIPKVVSILTTNFLLHSQKSWNGAESKHKSHILAAPIKSEITRLCMANPSLSECDDEAFQILKSEQNRQIGGIELIARYNK